MRFLFVKDTLAFPRSSGHDVHGFYLMQALAKLGHEVSLATLNAVDPLAIQGGNLTSLHTFAEPAKNPPPIRLTKLQEKFRSYWGVPSSPIQRIGEIATEIRAEAVVVVGLRVLPYLGAITNALRIWYAGDEWVWHHLSQVSCWQRKSWGELKPALVKGIYERAYAPLLDRVWMVSPTDQRAYRWVTGRKNVDVLPNGIDSDYYRPETAEMLPNSCVFWGRLDFGPNIQALEWFCKQVWPRVLEKVPRATFHIYGFQLTAEVKRLIEGVPRIILTPDLPDLRAEVLRSQVVVLPFVSGGGIKNKLLEAAAMGKAILCTPRTVAGLSPRGSVMLASSSSEWVTRLTDLWQNPEKRNRLGGNARRWVIEQHTWEAAAKVALAGLARSQ